VVSSLQVFGYFIALVALTYYSIGWEGVTAILPAGTPERLASLAKRSQAWIGGRIVLLALVAGLLLIVCLLALFFGGVRPYGRGGVLSAETAGDLWNR
jgi:hypothetical protein